MKILTIISIPLSVFAVVSLNTVLVLNANGEKIAIFIIELVFMLAYWSLFIILEEAINFLKR